MSMKDTLTAAARRLRLDKLRDEQKAAVDAVNSLVVVGATLLIGVIVLAMISDAMPSLGENSSFNGTMDSINSILVSAFELGAILPLVIIAGGLLFYVMRFGNSGGGGRR